MPFFLFMVGVSLGLTYKKLPNKVVAIRKATLRDLKLSVLGLVLQGGYFHGLNDLTYGVDIAKNQWMGILQVRTFRDHAFYLLKFIYNKLCLYKCFILGKMAI